MTVMGRRPPLDNDLLDALAATSPAALTIVQGIKARHRRRGRPSASEADYRRLELWWKSFRKLNSELTAEQAAMKFLRQRGVEIEKRLNLKRGTVQSLRNAVARGEKESERVKDRRKRDWQIMPSIRPFLVTDPNANETILISVAIRAALGKT